MVTGLEIEMDIFNWCWIHQCQEYSTWAVDQRLQIICHDAANSIKTSCLVINDKRGQIRSFFSFLIDYPFNGANWKRMIWISNVNDISSWILYPHLVCLPWVSSARRTRWIDEIFNRNSSAIYGNPWYIHSSVFAGPFGWLRMDDALEPVLKLNLKTSSNNVIVFYVCMCHMLCMCVNIVDGVIAAP